MMRKITLLSLVLMLTLGLKAQSIFFEDFQSGMPSNFILIDNDGKTPASQVSFVNQAWVAYTDFNVPTDTCAVSTSWYTPAGAADDWMILPKQSLGSGNFLIWRGWAPDPSYPDGYQVKISTSDSAMSSFTTNLATVAAENDSWTWHAVDLSAYNNQDVWIAFRNNSNDKFLLFIDDISIKHLDSFDVSGVSNTMINPIGLNNAPFDVSGIIKNEGSQNITSVELSYSINGGAAVSANLNGLNIAPMGTYAFTHPTAWTPTAAGNYTVKIWVDNINGNHADQNHSNDTITATIAIANQSTQCMPLYEEFTSSTCAPCASGNAHMTPILDANPNKWLMVKYQMNWPGAGDPYYTAEGGVRRTFYNVTGVPDMYIDGTTNIFPGSFQASDITAAYSKPSFLGINATMTINSSHSVDVDISLNPMSNFDANNSRLFVAIVERSTYNNVGSNGETKFYYVMKKMLPDANGTAISLTSGNTVSKQFHYQFNGSYRLPANSANPINHATEHSVENFDSLLAIVWVQNMSNKEVYQAAKSLIITGINESPAGILNKLYPNPADNQLQMEYRLEEEAVVSYRLISNTGQVVYQEAAVRRSAGTYHERLDVSKLAAGLYLLNLSINGEVSSRKLSIR